MKRPLREPLLHILLLGFALFGLQAALARPEVQARSPQAELVVAAGRIRSLEETRVRPWNRAPSKQELAGLRRDFVREEVLVRDQRADGSTQAMRLDPADPPFAVLAAPERLDVLATYLALGVEHILLGIDHLLFLLALLLLVSGWRRLLGTITAFSVSHCFTLTLASLGYVRLPGPPVEAAIALSILFVAGEILQRRRGRAGLTLRRPWVVSFTFGLLHGLGFAGALHELGLPQHDIPLALACFSAGVELGQLAFVAAVLALLAAGRRLLATLPAHTDFPAPTPLALETASAYAIGAVAAFWLVERSAGFFP